LPPLVDCVAADGEADNFVMGALFSASSAWNI
jgi:hypothetical protein